MKVIRLRISSKLCKQRVVRSIANSRLHTFLGFVLRFVLILCFVSSMMFLSLWSSTQSVSQIRAYFTSRKRIFWGVVFTKTKNFQCMKTRALASATLTCSPSVSGHFTLCRVSLCTSRRQFNCCRNNHLLNFWLVREFLVEIRTAKTDLLRWSLHSSSDAEDLRQL